MLVLTGAASPDPAAKAASKDVEYEAIQIVIEYDIRSPRDGIHAVRPNELYPHVSFVRSMKRFARLTSSQQRIPHCYTCASTADAARCWVPCVDSLWERCTWELIFSVASITSFEQETDQGLEVEEFPMYVIASGELIEQVSRTSLICYAS